MPRLRYDPDRDYYAVLRVPDSASQAEIQRAFRRLAKACHPDHHPDRQDWAKATFQAVSEAYQVLGSPQTRRDYDRLRWPHVRSGGGARARTRAASWAADWAAEARAAYTTEEDTTYDAAWTYADWARRTPPPPPAPEFSVGNPLQALRALLRGPYGPVYAIALLVILFMPVSYMAAQRFNGMTLDTVLAQAVETLPEPACQPGAVMIDAPLNGASVQSPFTVSGTAADPDMTAAVVEWAYLGLEADAVPEGAAWRRAADPLDVLVRGGTLAEVSLPDQVGLYALRLVVVRGDGTPLPPCERVVSYYSP
ncbi:MAG: J domain-containing protein [Anaerolineae bacterium]|nr:J domain-containing protein [Anaerolineae bacterium]